MYFVIEIQTNTIVNPIQTATTKNEAMGKYHTVLSYAAVSSVDYHTCMVVDERGQVMAKECYRHNQPPESTGE